MNYVILLVTKDEYAFKEVSNGRTVAIALTDEELTNINKDKLAHMLVNGIDLFKLNQ